MSSFRSSSIPSRQSYQLSEPTSALSSRSSITSTHPTRQHIGRGGAGNIIHASSPQILPPTTHPLTPQNSSSSSSTTSTTIRTGRGGAGNITHRATPSEKRIFSFDEELARHLQRTGSHPPAPVFHVGRGGAGNAAHRVSNDHYLDMDGCGGVRRDSAGTLGSCGSQGSTSSREETAPRKILRGMGRVRDQLVR